MKSELTLSLLWIRRMASPKSFATERVTTLSSGLYSRCGTVSVTMSSVIAESRRRARPVSSSWLCVTAAWTLAAPNFAQRFAAAQSVGAPFIWCAYGYGTREECATDELCVVEEPGVSRGRFF